MRRRYFVALLEIDGVEIDLGAQHDFLPLAFAAALFVRTDAQTMLRDARIEHDSGGVKKSFEAITLFKSGRATDLRTARAVIRDIAVSPRTDCSRPH